MRDYKTKDRRIFTDKPTFKSELREFLIGAVFTVVFCGIVSFLSIYIIR